MTPPAPGYIKTACAKCGQHVEAPVEYGGSFVPCPNCGEPIAIPAAEAPPSPTRTQRLEMPLPPPAPPLPPPARPAPGLPVSAIPPTNTTDAYLLPVLIILSGVTVGILAGTGLIDPSGPVVVLYALLAPLIVLSLLLGHLGAIAARLKTIETLLRSPTRFQ